MCRKLLKIQESQNSISLVRLTVLTILKQMKRETAERTLWCFAESEGGVILNEFHSTEEHNLNQREECTKVLRLILFCLLLEPNKRL